MCERRQGRAREAFTLIELLGVVAVISVLASMLLPALTKARARAKRVSCASQLKQHGLAMAMYADDQEGWIPNKLNGDAWTWHYSQDRLDGDYSLLRTLEYLDGEMRVCPASFYYGNRTYSYDGSSYTAYADGAAQSGTYTYFGGGQIFGGIDHIDWKFDKSQRLSQFGEPTHMLMTSDWYQPMQLNSRRDALDAGDWIPWDRYYYNNHDSWDNPSGMNTAWFDGHVDWSQPADVVQVNAFRKVWAPRNSAFSYSSVNYWLDGTLGSRWTSSYGKFLQVSGINP
jgi:prepilin-type N-terminal cleavage/methylation domain-containing protein/prepilin-type processing-associated H-X9-DG protein